MNTNNRKGLNYGDWSDESDDRRYGVDHVTMSKTTQITERV
jgi:hypothetical protein